MLFRQLEYFTAIARERHFARAAEACNVSQAALSDGLRKLEAELGVPLIRRRHAFEGLTPEGERLAVWARCILASQDALVEEAAVLKTGLSGELRIGTAPSASTTVAPVLDRFSRSHPLVSTVVDTKLPTQEITRRLTDFDLDAGLCYPFDAVPGLKQLHLYRETWVFLASEHMLKEVPEIMTWAQAGSHPLAILDSTMHGLEIMEEAFGRAGEEPRISVETDSVASLFALVHTGQWASVIPDRWITASGSTTDLVLVELTEPEVRTPIMLAYHETDPLSPLVRALIESISEPRSGERHQNH